LSKSRPGISTDLNDDARQLAVNTLSLQPPGPKHIGINNGVIMTAGSFVSMGSIHETWADDHSPKTIVLFCCVGLIASLCLMTFGIDLSTGWV
jgi:hypothetical protein